MMDTYPEDPASRLLLPVGRGLCDPHVRVFDQRLYLYASHDRGPENTGFRMDDWWIWSSSDMWEWHHESTVRPEQTYWGKAMHNCWAVDALDGEDGYYLYFSRGPCEIGVLRGSTPVGPWEDPLGRPLIADGAVATEARDPGLFRDEDGTAYLVFGTWDFYMARLNDDMISLAETPRLITIRNPEGPYGKGKTDDKPYLHKRNGIYYLSWGCYYAMADEPCGPYECRGAFFQTETADGPSRPASVPPLHDRHGSFFEWQGHSYFVCNEMALTGSMHFRDSSLHRIQYAADGSIQPVVLDSTPFRVGRS